MLKKHVEILGRVLSSHTRDIYVRRHERQTVIEIHKALGEKWGDIVWFEQDKNYLRLIVDNVPDSTPESKGVAKLL
jgi:hypothetical protein